MERASSFEEEGEEKEAGRALANKADDNVGEGGEEEEEEGEEEEPANALMSTPDAAQQGTMTRNGDTVSPEYPARLRRQASARAANLGPVRQDARLFAGLTMVLSRVGNSDQERHVASQIEAGGGTVADNFTPELLAKAREAAPAAEAEEGTGTATGTPGGILLVSGRASRTRKYLFALAAGIPCISRQFIEASCSSGVQHSPMDFLLPAGEVAGQRVLQRLSIGVGRGLGPTMPRRTFDGVAIHFDSRRSTPSKDWTLFRALFELAGGTLVSRSTFQAGPGGVAGTAVCCNFVVCDDVAPAKVVKKAKLWSATVVKTEWLIQCIIKQEEIAARGREYVHGSRRH
eukprot:UC1_evm2s1130